ncbi:hypothetical protein HOD24_05000 [Candidatus Peregrinibacteria bacterium]|jgi:hypothetical protein|nr:hypothetical protein [Candidatus Peregrinibacteria bacterium]
MNLLIKFSTTLIGSCSVLFLLAPSAFAYAGMGPLVPAIGSGVLLLFVLGMSFFGLIFYPIISFIKHVRTRKSYAKRKKSS